MVSNQRIFGNPQPWCSRNAQSWAAARRSAGFDEPGEQIGVGLHRLEVDDLHAAHVRGPVVLLQDAVGPDQTVAQRGDDPQPSRPQGNAVVPPQSRGVADAQQPVGVLRDQLAPERVEPRVEAVELAELEGPGVLGQRLRREGVLQPQCRGGGRGERARERNTLADQRRAGEGAVPGDRVGGGGPVADGDAAARRRPRSGRRRPRPWR